MTGFLLCADGEDEPSRWEWPSCIYGRGCAVCSGLCSGTPGYLEIHGLELGVTDKGSWAGELINSLGK